MACSFTRNGTGALPHSVLDALPYSVEDVEGVDVQRHPPVLPRLPACGGGGGEGEHPLTMGGSARRRPTPTDGRNAVSLAACTLAFTLRVYVGAKRGCRGGLGRPAGVDVQVIEP
mmetsp:Transcript_44895/g.108288  ORF Transcript_44895/g.108288 Transcript_44895/m.108288 type:complete len:115 (-) Transcript_44895:414-758(-)